LGAGYFHVSRQRDIFLRPNIVLIDFESVQPASLDVLAADHFNLKLSVGATQNKLPFNLVTAMQRMGERAEYIARTSASASGRTTMVKRLTER
jgi:hypothetical protein